MSFIGNQPATSFESPKKQVSTSNSGTTITLDYPVTSVADIRLTINAVVQSYDNYSVSGSTLTVGGTLNNDRVEILFVGRTYGSIAPSDASIVTSSLQDDAVTAAKLSSTAVDNTNTNSTLITAQTEKSSLVDADKFLISDSAASGALKYVQKSNLGGGAWELIYSEAQSSLGSGTFDVTDSALFSSDYNYYRIYILDWEPQNDSIDMNLQFKLGGTTRTSNYRFNLRRNESNSDQVNGAYSNSGGSIRIMEGCGNGTSENMSGWFEYQNPTGDNGLWYVTSCMYAGIESNGYTIGGVGQGSCSDSTGAMTGFTISAHSGGLGDFKLRGYGLKQS